MPITKTMLEPIAVAVHRCAVGTQTKTIRLCHNRQQMTKKFPKREVGIVRQQADKPVNTDRLLM